MNDTSDLIVERRSGALWLTLNRPTRLNALNDPLANELADVIASTCHDESIRVIVLQGAGQAFCSGLDISDREPGMDMKHPEGSGLARLGEIVVGLHECPQTVVALVNGAACGGGFAFALAADIRLASESARFNAAFVNLGLTGCELGTSYFLPRYVGTSLAAELLLTGRFLSAERALRCGLVSDVVPDGELEAAGEILVADLLRVNPDALRLGKQTMARTFRVGDLGEVLRIEDEAQAQCAAGPYAAEAMQAFLDKRPPVYTSH